MEVEGHIAPWDRLQLEVGTERAEEIVLAVLDVIQGARAARAGSTGYVRILTNARGAVVKVYRSLEVEQR